MLSRRLAAAWLLLATTTGCAALPPGVGSPTPAIAPALPAPESAVPAKATPAPAAASPLPPSAAPLLARCPPMPADTALLRDSLDQALEARDPFCWTLSEIALGRTLLKGSSEPSWREAGLHLRQATLRALRHGHFELVALARWGSAEVAMRSGDRPGTLHHLSEAALALGLDAASTGAPAAFADALLERRLIEALAAWRRDPAPHHLDAALETAAQLKALEALRGFGSGDIEPASLAEAAGLPELSEALLQLRSLREASTQAWGPDARSLGPQLEAAAERVAGEGTAWALADPLLLDWIPSRLPQLTVSAQAVLADGELLLDFSVGEITSAVIVLSERGRSRHLLPSRAALAPLLSSCDRGDCGPLRAALLGPVEGALKGARQVLVAAHGLTHQAPFEAWIPSPRRVHRVPSPVALFWLRLRAWEQGGEAHPGALSLLPGPARPVALDGDAAPPTQRLEAWPEGLSYPRLALSAGAHLVKLASPGLSAPLSVGAPLTVPGALPSAPAEDGAEPSKDEKAAAGD